MKKMDKGYKKSLSFLFQWIIISISAGIVGSVMVAFFTSIVSRSSSFILSTTIPIPLWTISGALICGLIFYKISPTASGDGIPSYIKGVLDNNGVYSFRETFSKFAATAIALITLSNGGMLGPAGRVSAGLSSKAAGFLMRTGFMKENRRTAAICGMSAAVGAIFNSPVGGGIFAVEVLQRANMRYTDLFPAVLSSSVAVYIFNFFPMENPLFFSAPVGIFEKSLMFPILVTSLGAAYMGRLYTMYYDYISSIFRKGNRQKIILKLFIGALTASSLVFLFSPEMAGNIKGLAEALFAGEVFPLKSFFSSFPVPVV
ncbi:MAG: chloride channel protein, partial [Spirochaetaceae bacterium]|nr:chloride channel protein [Spirochaetaceae bacterium]